MCIKVFMIIYFFSNATQICYVYVLCIIMSKTTSMEYVYLLCIRIFKTTSLVLGIILVNGTENRTPTVVIITSVINMIKVNRQSHNICNTWNYATT